MRAVVCDRLGDPSVLKIVELETPTPGPNEVLVRVRAAALNFPDVLMVAGQYQHKPPLPFTPGMEAAGEVVAVGADVRRHRPGEGVIFGKRPGCFAEYVAVPEGNVTMSVPQGWSFAEAASFRVAAVTAFNALVHRGRLQAGETLLVHGATGGVGMAAVQLGRHLGARVIATGSDPGKLAVVRQQGADHTIDLTAGDFVQSVKSLTEGRGVDAIYDPVGGELLERSLRCAAFGARLLIIGFTSGGPTLLKSNHILIKCLSVLGVRAGEANRRDPRIGEDYVRELPRLAASGVMRPHISHRFRLEDIVQGMQTIIDRKVIGKAVLEL